MSITYIRKKSDTGQSRIRSVIFQNRDGSELPVLEFPSLEETGIVRHFFTTRMGGVSKGFLSTMNLSHTRGDDKACLEENYLRVSEALGTTPDKIVATHQIHGTKILRVFKEDAGKGITRPKEWDDVDGLITNEPGLCLATFFADCVPVMVVDPVHKAIGSCHSGWRGTVGRIGAVMIEKMHAEFGSRPEDLICAIGPSICRDCYEVSDDVAEEFRTAFPGREEEILVDKHNGHAQLDLWRACRIVLEDAGVPASQISVTDICTCCNPDLLFSHRASKGKRGNIAGFLMLKENEDRPEV